MDAHHLIDMANRIGQFFEAYPDEEEAIEGIGQHIRKFWEPRMRRQLLELLDQQADAGLDALVLRALHQHRDALR